MRRLWWAVSLLLMAVIWLFGSGLPGTALPRAVVWLGRALEGLVLGYALGRATGKPGLALGLAAWFGAADEVHRAFMAVHDSGIQDWLSGLLGAWLGSRLAARRAADPEGQAPLSSGHLS